MAADGAGGAAAPVSGLPAAAEQSGGPRQGGGSRGRPPISGGGRLPRPAHPGDPLRRLQGLHPPQLLNIQFWSLAHWQGDSSNYYGTGPCPRASSIA
eukprot:1185536-Prorocentrum_minimum.AAC.1